MEFIFWWRQRVRNIACQVLNATDNKWSYKVFYLHCLFRDGHTESSQKGDENISREDIWGKWFQTKDIQQRGRNRSGVFQKLQEGHSARNRMKKGDRKLGQRQGPVWINSGDIIGMCTFTLSEMGSHWGEAIWFKLHL